MNERENYGEIAIAVTIVLGFVVFYYYAIPRILIFVNSAEHFLSNVTFFSGFIIGIIVIIAVIVAVSSFVKSALR